MAEVVGLFLYGRKGATPLPVPRVRSNPLGGLEGDWHGSRFPYVRSILMVDRAVLDDLGLGPGDLREQVTVEGLPELDSLASGTRLLAGEAELEITKECGPCLTIGAYNRVRDAEAFRDALRGRRGVFVRFVEGSPREISLGDPVRARAASQA